MIDQDSSNTDPVELHDHHDHVDSSSTATSNKHNTVGLKFALPVLGGLLLLVGLTAGALLYNNQLRTFRSDASPLYSPVATATPIPANPCGNACSAEYCHCTGGDACTGYECVNPTWVQNVCTSQGRSWCDNYQSGGGKTCCYSGYSCCQNEEGCCRTGSTPPPTNPPTNPPTRTRTPTITLITVTRTPTQATRTPTRTPTQATRTPTRTPTVTLSGCTSYTVDETSGTGSRFLKYGLSPFTITSLSTFCSHCDVEGMDNSGSTVYVVANDENTAGARICHLDRNSGALNSCINTADRLEALSFRSGTLWAWKAGTGLVTVNLSNGAQTLMKSSTLNATGIAWNNSGSSLYIIKDNTRELYVYNPSTGSITLHTSNFPSTNVDSLDFSPDGWLVAPATTNGITVYAYDVVNKITKATWNKSTSQNNWDAVTAMCDLPGI